MKNAKKVVAVVALIAMTAIASVAGTLAYLTDRDSKANVFTIGDVSIEINEDFAQGTTLIPGVKIEKEPTITNTGKNDAWVWAEIAIPAALDNPDASKNVVHFNFSKDSVADGYWNWTDAEGNYLVKENVEINQVNYTVYTVLYETVLKASETTAYPVMTTVYMDTHVDVDPEGNWHWVEHGEATDLNWNSESNGNPVFYVSAYAIQAEGFETINDAYAAYQSQWGDNGSEWGEVPVLPSGYIVTNSEELAAAVEAGETEIWLEAGTYQAPAAAKGKTLTINGTHDAVLEVVPGGQSEANGQLDYHFDGSTVTFNGITIQTNSQLYAGYARLSAVYNDCVIQNTYNLGTGNSEFNNCTFNITNEYLRVGGAYTATFNNCTFNTDGRAILVFQDGSKNEQTVTVKDCTFNATAPAYTWNGIHVAAVSYDGSQGGTYTVNFEGENTVDANFNGLWQIKNGEANVTVNGLE